MCSICESEQQAALAAPTARVIDQALLEAYERKFDPRTAEEFESIYEMASHEVGVFVWALADYDEPDFKQDSGLAVSLQDPFDGRHAYEVTIPLAYIAQELARIGCVLGLAPGAFSPSDDPDDWMGDDGGPCGDPACLYCEEVYYQ